MTEVTAVGLCGSLRRGSLNAALLNAAVSAGQPRIDLRVFDLAPVPMYNQDLESDGDPEPVAVLKAAVRQADLVVIATPEYNAGLPGVLKNALDWVSRPPRPQAWDGKPVAVMGATPGGFGTTLAQAQLRASLAHAGAHAMPLPRMMLSRAGQAFTKAGALADPRAEERMSGFMAAAADWAVRFRTGD